jgi:non-heme chloroperoxidase
MNNPRFENLEVLARCPQGPCRPTPLLFVHGAYTAAWCWDEHVLPFFAGAGYAAYAVSLSGHGASRGREHLDSLSIADYVRDVAEVASRLPAPPILIGHSMGGFVVQKYLEDHASPAAVLMCSVPPQGLISSAFSLMLSRPGLMKDLNSLMGGGPVALDSLREALFSQPVDVDDLKRFYRLAQPESYRAIWDMTLFNLPHPSQIRQTPLMVIGAEHDHLIPVSLVEMTARTYGVPAKLFPGLGHGMMLERDWKKPAQHMLDWFTENGL